MRVIGKDAENLGELKKSDKKFKIEEMNYSVKDRVKKRERSNVERKKERNKERKRVRESLRERVCVLEER